VTNKSRYVPTVLLALIAAGTSVSAQTIDYPSLSGTRAKVIAVGKGRESRIEIRSSHGKLIRWKSFTSSDGEHGKAIGHAAWTSDAEFFVFSTTNTGGHQPWSWMSYFYSRRKNRFYCLDDFIGPVTSDFTLSERNVIKTTRLTFPNHKPEEEPVVVRLNRLRL
jgi:hypothetical protein